MSLINEALKRAQHQRKVEEAGFAPPVPGGSNHRIAHRGKPMASQTLLLVVAASAVLIVLTVVATVYLLRDSPPAVPDRPSPSDALAPVASQTETDLAPSVVLAIPSPVAAMPKPSAAAPAIAGPVIEPAVAHPSATTANPAVPAITPSPPAPATNETKPASSSPVPAMTTVAKAPPPAAKESLVPDQQVLIFLDNLKIMGVRFSGIDSKVLISDRVFRVNDVIERNFGLRLVEVQPDRLIFVDAKGIAYSKSL